MASSVSPPDPSVGPTLPGHLAAVCSSFEESWKGGRRPRIEEVLERTRPFDRTTLLPHLIRIEVRHRVELGETPRPDEYLARFPDDRNTIGGIDWRSLTPQGPARGAAGRADEIASTIVTAPLRRRAVGRYELIERLGAGGFGEVWRAFDSHLQRDVAIKIGHFDAADRSQAALLLHEARSAGRLRHPRIVRIHEAGTEGDVAYIVSDHIPGTNLAAKLKSGPLSAEAAASIALELADALAHAHDHGIVHRDIKPANVLIDPDGEPHLTDFGVARRAAGDKTISEVGQAIGTPAYMSPEQARGETAVVDLRTDVYALGLVLYEMLAGRRAYLGDAQTALFAVLQGPPERLRTLRPDVPRDLETIVEIATSRDRSDRYPVATALKEDLDRFLRGAPVLGKRPGAPERTRRWLRRRGGAVAAAVAVGCAALGALAGVIAATRDRPVAGDSSDGAGDETTASSSASAVPPGITGDPGGTAPPRPAAGGAEVRLVEIRTEPSGADIWLFPLDPETGMVQADKLNDPPGRSPVRLELPVGFYHIVADLGEGRFTEVTRRVPPAADPHTPDGKSMPLANIAFTNWLSIPGGIAVILPVPEAPRLGDFAYVEGGSFRTEGGGRPSGLVVVPPFYVAPVELTFGRYLTIARETWRAHGREKADDDLLPWYVRGLPFDPDEAIPLHFADADRAAGDTGGRLPDEFEWELVARRAAVPDWDAMARELTGDGFGPAGVPASDRVDTVPAVLGLRSNVAEWTSSWFTPPAETLHLYDLRSRVVRGGDRETISGSPAVSATSRDVGLRLPGEVQPDGYYPGVGCRLARSVKPRKAPEDFPRILADEE